MSESYDKKIEATKSEFFLKQEEYGLHIKEYSKDPFNKKLVEMHLKLLGELNSLGILYFHYVLESFKYYYKLNKNDHSVAMECMDDCIQRKSFDSKDEVKEKFINKHGIDYVYAFDLAYDEAKEFILFMPYLERRDSEQIRMALLYGLLAVHKSQTQPTPQPTLANLFCNEDN